MEIFLDIRTGGGVNHPKEMILTDIENPEEFMSQYMDPEVSLIKIKCSVSRAYGFEPGKEVIVNPDHIAMVVL